MFNDEFKKQYSTLPFATFSRNYNGGKNDFHTLSHNHKEIEILAVLEGSARFCTESESFEAKKGDIVIVSPYLLHHAVLYAEEKFSHICLCFDLSVLGDEKLSMSLEDGSMSISHIVKSENEGASDMLDYIREAYDANEQKDEGWEFSIKGNMMLMFARLKKCGYIRKSLPVREADMFRKIINYIESHYAENITSKHISSYLYISNAHFCRVFKENFGHCFQNYLCMYRIEKAKRLLEETELPVSEIAVKTGFSSFSYFSKMFKEYTALTPSVYRKSLIL